MLRVRGAKQITLRAIPGWISHPLLECCVEGNGVERHLNTGRSRELRPHAAHALACRSLPLHRFPLDHQHVFASRGSQVIGNARANNPSANNDNLRCMHEMDRTSRSDDEEALLSKV